jgi:hypothetical protein
MLKFNLEQLILGLDDGRGGASDDSVNSEVLLYIANFQPIQLLNNSIVIRFD